MIQLFNEDCHSFCKTLKKESINLILIDPPYGTTPLEWDKHLDFNVLWKEYKRILKEDGCILIFGQEPFSSFIRMSNIDWYRYDWYWIKERLTNVLQVKRRPGKVVETISVFYRNQCKYFPIKREHIGKRVANKIGKNGGFSSTIKGMESSLKPVNYRDDSTRHPTQILYFNRDHLQKTLHETQKPLALIEYLIETYTEEEDIVLDHCMGSGTAGVACRKLNRSFIGVEDKENIFAIAKNRIETYPVTKKLF